MWYIDLGNFKHAGKHPYRESWVISWVYFPLCETPFTLEGPVFMAVLKNHCDTIMRYAWNVSQS
jgi:hypothetical protein